MRSCFAIIVILLFASCSDSTGGSEQAPITIKKETLDIKKNNPNPYVDKDVSIMDMTYYPPDYPSLKMHHLATTAPFARVIYSRPIKLGRKIFGGLVPYGKQWRLGANEATEIEFFKAATIQGKKINPGRYILYCVPEAAKWTLVLNNDIFTWGKEIDSSKDILKFEVPVTKPTAPCEDFTMLFRDEGNNHAGLIMAWDDVAVNLPIEF